MRDDEIAALRKWISEILIISIVTNYVSNFMGLLTVTTYALVSLYAHSGSGVSTSTIFTVISTIGLLADPLRSLGQQIGNIVSASASWKRIEEFLLSNEQQNIGVVEDDRMDDGLRLRPAAGSAGQAFQQGISFANAAFGIQDKITLLHGVNIELDKPALWMVVGRVGSVSTASFVRLFKLTLQGKSTLLQAVLGELDLISGSAHRSLGRVGFCSQDPWLLNASIRANITFMNTYDPTWYRTVLEALDLDTDLSILPDGDLTMTSGLSGGQRQRRVWFVAFITSLIPVSPSLALFTAERTRMSWMMYSQRWTRRQRRTCSVRCSDRVDCSKAGRPYSPRIKSIAWLTRPSSPVSNTAASRSRASLPIWFSRKMALSRG
jgi:ABC-type multidrug transport system fused ATPase/permease subunit